MLSKEQVREMKNKTKTKDIEYFTSNYIIFFYFFIVITLGDSGVGKTSLINT